MNCKSYFLIVISSFIFIFSSCQENTGPYLGGGGGGGSDQWEDYTKANGLVNNNVRALGVDPGDTLWVGTSGGLSKFDGSGWTNYTEEDGLISDTVRAIVVDKTGNIWIGTNRGLSKFNHNNWKNYTKENGLPSNNIHTLALDQNNNLWIGTDSNSISRFNGSTFKNYVVIEKFGTINTLCFDNQDNLWVGSEFSGLSKLDLTTMDWRHYVNDLNMSVSGSLCTPTELWFAVYGEGVYRFSDNLWEPFDEEDGLISKYINVIEEDHSNSIWFGTSEGLSRYDGTTWTNHSVATGLVGNTVFDLAVDSENNLWVATGKGLSKSKN